MKTPYYSINAIIKQRLLMRPDGQPFTSLTGVMRRVRAFGFEKTVLDRRGMLVYGITKKDLEKMNSYKYEPKK